jgi:hypothetical protein
MMFMIGLRAEVQNEMDPEDKYVTVDAIFVEGIAPAIKRFMQEVQRPHNHGETLIIESLEYEASFTMTGESIPTAFWIYTAHRISASLMQQSPELRNAFAQSPEAGQTHDIYALG